MRSTLGHKIIRVVALFTTFTLLFIGLTTRASDTDAAWNSSETTQGSFVIGQVGTVENLACIDSEDGLLGTGLLRNQVHLVWEAPAGLENNPNVTYEVTWDAGLLGSKGSVVLDSLSYTHTATGSLLSLGIDFTVRAIVSEWVSPTVTEVRANGIGLLVNVYLGCA